MKIFKQMIYGLACIKFKLGRIIYFSKIFFPVDLYLLFKNSHEQLGYDPYQIFSTQPYENFTTRFPHK